MAAIRNFPHFKNISKSLLVNRRFMSRAPLPWEDNKCKNKTNTKTRKRKIETIQEKYCPYDCEVLKRPKRNSYEWVIEEEVPCNPFGVRKIINMTICEMRRLQKCLICNLPEQCQNLAPGCNTVKTYPMMEAIMKGSLPGCAKTIPKQNLTHIRHYYYRKVKEGCECPDPPKPKIVEEKKLIQTSRNLTHIRHYYYRKVKEGCECPDPPKPKIVEEKKCLGCSFQNWKPKTRKQIIENVEKDKTPKPPMECYAGMVTTKCIPDCKPQDSDPFKKKLCKDAKKEPEEMEMKKEVEREKPLPYADWDVDCR